MSGTDRRTFATGWLISAAILSVICIVNIQSGIHTQPQFRPLAHITWETTSLVMGLLLTPLPFLLVRWHFRRPDRWPLIAAVAIVAAPLYSLAHTFGFLIQRKAVYALLGWHYDYGPLSVAIPYEMGKDVLALAGGLVTFWIAFRLAAPPVTPPGPAAAAPMATYDIREGARVIRVPVDTILTVSSAGNYVEFRLADGRKPLVRSALSAVETELATLGFVRTHRSWLVNAARVTELVPEGSGDYAVHLGEAVAPLSRRFPDALARLKGG